MLPMHKSLLGLLFVESRRLLGGGGASTLHEPGLFR